MSNARLAVVKRAWNFLTKGAAKIAFEELAQCYIPEAHPRVVSREKLARTVKADFEQTMSCLADQDGAVSEEAFIEYYACISMVLPAERESYFCELVVQTWGLTKNQQNVHSSRIAQMEDIVFEKIRQRTHGADDEGKTAKRIFKHFDLDGFGTISFKEFAASLETIGCVFPLHEMQALFNKVDKNGNGKVDYEEFSAWFALRGSGNNPNVNPVFGLARDPPTQVLDKILKTLAAKEAGVRSLSLLFRKVDKDGNGTLDRHEVQWVLRQQGLKLSPSEFERLFKYFDKNGDGVISCHEFIHGVRGELSGKRLELAQQLAAKLAVAGEINLADMVDACDYSMDPMVASGKFTVAQRKAWFASLFDHQVQHGKITVQDFLDFETDMAAGVVMDDLTYEKYFRQYWAKLM